MSVIPVTLLTGFLGSGKTTLLSAVLRDPRFSDTAVIINEFGEIGLDHVLLETSHEDLVQMTSGCLCCTVRGDVRQTLLSLHARLESGMVPTFSRVVIETTGLADPAPVLHTLMADPQVFRRYALSGVITVVDGVVGGNTLDRHPESLKQVAVADRIVFTKTDLARDPSSRRDVALLRDRVRSINPGAQVLDRRADDFDLRRLFDTSVYDTATKSTDVLQWLNAEAYRSGHEHSHAHVGHEHAHHEHGHGEHGHGDGRDADSEAPHIGGDHRHPLDVNRHGDDIRAFCVVIDEPLSAMAVGLALELLVANRGEDLLRVKGILHVAGRSNTPCVIHGVQHVFHEPSWLDAWPSEDHRSRIVFITRGLSADMVEPLIAAFSGLPPQTEAVLGGSLADDQRVP